MKKFLFIFLGMYMLQTFAQVNLQSIPKEQIKQEWQLRYTISDTDTIINESAENLFYLKPDGSFSENASKAQGNWFRQDSTIYLRYSSPSIVFRTQKIKKISPNQLTLEHNGKIHQYVSETHPAYIPPKKIAPEPLVKAGGFTLTSFLRGMLGFVAILFIAFLFSTNRKQINWRTVGIGLGIQVVLGIGILKVPAVRWVFEKVGNFFILVLDYTRAGSEFLLGGFMDVESYGFIFVFQVLPTIIFFSALTSVLFYLGIIQIVVKGLAWVMTKTLQISGTESLSVAGNIFLGQTESPLMIKAYLEKMNKSEIFLVMVGGMATVAGGVLAAYVSFLGGGNPEMEREFARHLLAASVMAAPGAIIISKILVPQTGTIDKKVKVSYSNIGTNVLDAMSVGTTEGLKLAANVGAMLLVFVAFIMMINSFLGWVGDITTFNQYIAENTPYQAVSLEMILGYVFAPLMYLIGVAQEDISLMGQLLGVKLAASEFVGYIQLAELKNIANPTHFKYEKSVIMATYMLCGFANFASIGIQIGGIGSLAPGQRVQLSKFGLQAVLGGTLASLLSATIVGMLLG